MFCDVTPRLEHTGETMLRLFCALCIPVLRYLCTCVRVCAVWLCGCVLCGCVAVWLCGCVVLGWLPLLRLCWAVVTPHPGNLHLSKLFGLLRLRLMFLLQEVHLPA